MIAPLYSAPPMLERYAGSSGISMLKLDEKRNELRPNNQNCVVNIPGEAVFCIAQKYDTFQKERNLLTAFVQRLFQSRQYAPGFLHFTDHEWVISVTFQVGINWDLRYIYK
jgi:hypothetical protein